MRIDGGRSLTSRGQNQWYGQKFANRKFMPEERSTYANYMLFKKKEVRPPQGRGQEIETWCDAI